MANVINFPGCNQVKQPVFNQDYALDVIAEALGPFFVLESARPANEVAIQRPSRVRNQDFSRFIRDINDGTGLKLLMIREAILPDETGAPQIALIFHFDPAGSASALARHSHA